MTVGGNSGQASGEDNGNGHGDTDAGEDFWGYRGLEEDGDLI